MRRTSGATRLVGMTTTASRATRPGAPPRARREWWIPASLLALTFVPAAAGAARLVDLSSGRTTENARFFDLPVPVVVHILGATTYCVLGAFQFMPSFRRRRPRWHRWSGRVLVPAGLAAAVSGLVMGVAAIRARDVRTHQRWMARSYAVAQGAGTQALVLGPMVLFVDQPGGGLKAAGMGFAWVLNLAVAEWLVRRSQARQSSRRV